MLNELTSNRKPDIAVVRRRIPVILEGIGLERIRIEFPPVEELREIRELASQQISFQGVIDAGREDRGEAFAAAAKDAMRKEVSFGASPSYLSRVADLWNLAGNWPAAEDFNRRAFQQQPDALFALKVGGDLVRAGKLDDAEQVLSATTTASEDELLTRRASIALLQGRVAQANEFAMAAMETNPASYSARCMLGLVALASGQFEKAVRNFRAAMEDAPSSSALLVNLAISYVCLGEESKAIRSLRRAVGINPLDENAVAVLADLSFSMNQSSLAQNALEQYLRYEQRSAPMWARLARIRYAERRYVDCDVALKHQCAISDSPFAWNNRGVVATARGDQESAGRYFAHALQKCEGASISVWFAPTTNFLSWLLDGGRTDDALNISDRCIALDESGEVRSNEAYAQLYLLNLSSLARKRSYTEYSRRAFKWLEDRRSSRALQIGIYIGLLHHFSLRDVQAAKAAELARRALQFADEEKDRGTDSYRLLLNNIAYAFIETGNLEEGRTAIERLSRWVHKDPYVTATIGLYHLRRAEIERGMGFYEEAAQLTADIGLRGILRQKLDLELGTLLLAQGDMRKAVRLLRRAAEVKNGLDGFAESARKSLALLPRGEA